MNKKELLQQYHQLFAEKQIKPDAQQQVALEKLAAIAEQLSDTHKKLTHHKIKHHINKLFGLKQHPIKGIYFWGGVGRGKTLLMDMFFQTLPFRAKKRVHFHPFMRHVHHELRKIQGMKNPLRSVAKEIAKETHVLCFDEFFVDDVADALILAELLEQIFHEGVTLIFTSNTKPDELYKNGVQRQLFLPAIRLIKNFTEVINLDAGEDYRLRTLLEKGVYFTPINEETQTTIKQEFLALATGDVQYGSEVEVLNRKIPCAAMAHKMIWFDFKDICVAARSSHDYLALLDDFDTFIVGDVPLLGKEDLNATKRFIHLIDVLYDNHATLILSSAVAIEELYQGEELKKEFQRTQSRLREMFSRDYLRQPHLK
jgi:cell division protein ZapE